MTDDKLLGLILVIAPLSLLSFGGGQAIIAALQHETVAHGWVTNSGFTDFYAMARVAPGPSTLIVALIGFKVAGFLGALVSIVAIYLPSCAVVYAASSWWQRHPVSVLKRAIEQGLAPVAVGLIFAGAVAVFEAAHANLLMLATAAICTAALFYTRVSIYLVVVLAAASYLAVYTLA